MTFSKVPQQGMGSRCQHLVSSRIHWVPDCCRGVECSWGVGCSQFPFLMEEPNNADNTFICISVLQVERGKFLLSARSCGIMRSFLPLGFTPVFSLSLSSGLRETAYINMCRQMQGTNANPYVWGWIVHVLE